VLPSGIVHDSRYLEPYPIYVNRAEGAHKWDVDGNKYVDYYGGHGALLLGHNDERVIEAVHRRRLRTTNLVERLNEEIKRRTRVARLFPNEASCLRLESAVLMEISEDWQTAEKRYVVFEEEDENLDAIRSDRIYRKKVA